MAHTANIRRYYRLARQEDINCAALCDIYWRVMTHDERDAIDTHYNRSR